MIVGGEGPGIMVAPAEEEGVVAGVMAAGLGGEPDKTLQEARFVIGDFISCAVFAPLPDGAVAPGVVAGSSGRGRGMGEFRGGGPRENGFGGFRGKGVVRGGGQFNGPRVGDGGLPSGEWRRGERIPDGPSGGRGYARGRGRGY